MEPTYDVVWPKSPMGVQQRQPAARLDDLDGKRIGFLWDDLFRGDELFPVLEQELTAHHPSLEVVGYEAFGSTHGADEVANVERLPSELAARHIDAVVSGMGC